MSRFNLNADMFMAALLCASRDETRYYLAGVHVEPCPEGGVLMVTTDGHRLAVFHDEDGVAPRHGIFSTKSKIARTPAKAAGPHRIAFDADDKKGGEHSAIIYDLGAPVDVALVTEIDGTFPEWRRIYPNGPEKGFVPSGFNAFDFDHLGVVRKSSIRAFGRDATSFDIIETSKGGPLSIIPNSHTHAARFLVMPMRGSSQDQYPSWIEPAKEADEEAA